MSLDTNFNLEEEYKPSPLIPQGSYNGSIIEARLDESAGCIIIKVSLNGSGAYKTDGETEVDGSHEYMRIWLPKVGDEDQMTASGKQTKRQAKINMMKDAFDKLKLQINTFDDIKNIVEMGELIGLDVVASIGISEYQGRVRNEVNSLVAEG